MALAMWWHLPGSSLSMAVKVERVPVLGSPDTGTSVPCLLLKASLKHKLTCSNQNKLYIIMDFLFCLRNIHFLIFQVNAAVCPSWQQNCTLLLLLLYAMHCTSSYLITMKSSKKFIYIQYTIWKWVEVLFLAQYSINMPQQVTNRGSSDLWEGKHSDNSW